MSCIQKIQSGDTPVSERTLKNVKLRRLNKLRSRMWLVILFCVDKYLSHVVEHKVLSQTISVNPWTIHVHRTNFIRQCAVRNNGMLPVKGHSPSKPG